MTEYFKTKETEHTHQCGSTWCCPDKTDRVSTDKGLAQKMAKKYLLTALVLGLTIIILSVYLLKYVAPVAH